MEQVAKISIPEPLGQATRTKISRRLGRLKRKYAHAYDIQYLWSESGNKVCVTVKHFCAGEIVFSGRTCRIYLAAPAYLRPLLWPFRESLEREVLGFFPANHKTPPR